METIITALFYNNWQRKLVALITAIIIWFFVNHSIIEPKTLSNIPVRVHGLSPDKTIQGMLPNGFLSKRITLTLSGTKEVMDELEPGDLEVSIDASTADQNDWIVQITKKNLVSLNPSIDLVNHITQVAHTEFVVKLSQLVTQKIPIRVLPPKGEPPQGYEYLNIWPQTFVQSVSGPEEEIKILKAEGLEVEFDLSEITKADLDGLRNPKSTFNDEVSFKVPEKWKYVTIPFHNNTREDINDPDAQHLHIDFLRKESLAIDKELPIRVYYPTEYSSTINPNTYSLELGSKIQLKNGIPILTLPLYLKDVSQLFLETIRENMEIAIVAAPLSEREILQWSVDVIAPYELEDVYVGKFLAHLEESRSGQHHLPKTEEAVLRKRFRDYMQRVMLYLSPDKKLKLQSRLDDHKVKVAIH